MTNLWDHYRLSTPQYFAVTLALAVAVSMLVTIATAKRPPPPPKAAVEISKDESYLSTKGDRESRPIRTIPISKPGLTAAAALVPAPLPVPDEPLQRVAMAEPVAEPTPELVTEPVIHRHWHESAPRHHAEHDICARHGGHRVETHNGKSWRCRY